MNYYIKDPQLEGGMDTCIYELLEASHLTLKTMVGSHKNTISSYKNKSSFRTNMYVVLYEDEKYEDDKQMVFRFLDCDSSTLNRYYKAAKLLLSDDIKKTIIEFIMKTRDGYLCSMIFTRGKVICLLYYPIIDPDIKNSCVRVMLYLDITNEPLSQIVIGINYRPHDHLITIYTCKYCRKTGSEHLICSQCNTVFYCNETCMKRGRKRHKPLCKNIKKGLAPKCTFCDSFIGSRKICTGCNISAYCNGICQKADWKTHKSICRNSQFYKYNNLLKTPKNPIV